MVYPLDTASISPISPLPPSSPPTSSTKPSVSQSSSTSSGSPSSVSTSTSTSGSTLIPQPGAKESEKSTSHAGAIAGGVVGGLVGLGLIAGLMFSLLRKSRGGDMSNSNGISATPWQMFQSTGSVSAPSTSGFASPTIGPLYKLSIISFLLTALSFFLMF